MLPTLFSPLKGRTSFALTVLMITFASASALLAQTLETPHAGFERVNNFNTGFGNTTWATGVAESASVEIILDPIGYNGTGNKVLAYGFEEEEPYTELGIVLPLPEINSGEKGTIFFRVAVADAAESNCFAGITEGADLGTTGGGDARAGIAIPSSGALTYLDGPDEHLEVMSPGEFEDMTWYRFWILVDSATDTSSLYVQGGGFSEQTLLAEDVSYWTPSDGKGITHFLLLAASQRLDSGAYSTGTHYFDDLYVHVGEHNLANPVDPYPALEIGFTRTGAAPAVDGVKEPSIYLKTFDITRVPHLSPEQVPPESLEDHSGTISGAYTDQGLYIYVEVIDDVIVVDSISPDSWRPWDDDNIEILFDPDNNDNGRFDGVNDTKYVVTLLGDGTAEIALSAYPVPAPGGDWSAFEAVYVETDVGWDVEFFFPWAGLQIEPTGDWRMGVEVEINDDDDDGLRDGLLTIGSRDVPNHHTDQYPTAELWEPKTAIIVPSEGSAEITIDGSKDAAYGNAPVNRSTGRSGDSPAPPVGETSFTWQAIHDEEFLYLFFEVLDDDLSIDSPESSWNDDGLELYVDGDNSKGSTTGSGFDGVDDVKITFRPQLDGSVAIDSAGNHPAPPAGADFTGLEAAYVKTGMGWSLEVRVALATYGISAPTPGQEIGIDLQLNDDDNGGSRDYTVTWSSGVALNDRVDLWGHAQFFGPNEAEISFTDATIVVNGQIDQAYSGASWHELVRGGRDLSLPSANRLSASWAGVYDQTNLYLLVDVVDDNSSQPDDGVEIAVGGNNTKIGFWPNIAQSLVVQSDADVSGLTVAQTDTDLGYRIEAKIPFEVVGSTPATGEPIRFDVQISDASTASRVDYRLGWSSISHGLSASDEFGQISFAPGSFASRIGAAAGADDWYQSEWLGWFHERWEHDNWIYHLGLGWLHVGTVQSGGSPMWIYSASLDGWLYTGESIFPHVWVESVAGWTYYSYFDVDSVYLYIHATDTWMKL